VAEWVVHNARDLNPAALTTQQWAAQGTFRRQDANREWVVHLGNLSPDLVVEWVDLLCLPLRSKVADLVVDGVVKVVALETNWAAECPPECPVAEWVADLEVGCPVEWVVEWAAEWVVECQPDPRFRLTNVW
jgi:hypothetical protein